MFVIKANKPPTDASEFVPSVEWSGLQRDEQSLNIEMV